MPGDCSVTGMTAAASFRPLSFCICSVGTKQSRRHRNDKDQTSEYENFCDRWKHTVATHNRLLRALPDVLSSRALQIAMSHSSKVTAAGAH